MNSLVDFRVSNNLTQLEISKKIGISHSYYSKIELGIRNPSFDFLFKFKNTFKDANIDKIFFENKSHEMFYKDSICS